MLSVCLGKLYGREGKKKSQEEKKIDSRATLMQPEYFRCRREGKRDKERDRAIVSTYLSEGGD